MRVGELASGQGAAQECVRRLVAAYGETRAAVLIAWLLEWGRRGGPVLEASDDALHCDWRVFQERSAGREWPSALESVESGLPVTALALERFLHEVFVLLNTWHLQGG